MSRLNRLLKKWLPSSTYRWIGYLRWHHGIKLFINHRRTIRKIRKQKSCPVIFVASQLAMWRYQRLFDILLKDPRFQPQIIISPFSTFSPDERTKCVEQLKAYFEAHHIPHNVITSDVQLNNLVSEGSKGIIFYPQPYEEIYTFSITNERIKDWLMAYHPYAISTVASDAFNNSRFLNITWRIFQPTLLHKADSKKLADNHGINIRITGDAHADDFIGEPKLNPWKKIEDGNVRKKIIFAPHFQINKNGTFNRAAFLWSYKIMVDIAKKYEKTIQIAFKPHPRLRSELYGHPDWGKKRTDEYYHLWEVLPNTQLETGEFVDLFKTSDALIHNCGSFTAEYLFTGKPVLFLTQDMHEITDTANDFGLKCIDMHYRGKSAKDIESFITTTILGQEDPLKEERVAFHSRYLLPPNGRSAASNMYAEICKSLGWK